MVNFVSERITKIKDEYLNLEEVKRIKELELYIDTNIDINNTFQKIKEIQKKIVHAKEFNQFNILKELEIEYNDLKEKLLDLPFVEEYLELLDIVNNMLTNTALEIEEKINNELK